MTNSEQASITVLVSPELVEHLNNWSNPVKVKIIKVEDGTYEMIAMRVDCE